MKVEKVSEATLPTRFGLFNVVAFKAGGLDHVALVRGKVDGCERVLVRLHSQCLTGDTFCSLRCDCREQLEASLRLLGRKRRGVLLYLPQEGRGIGLANKIMAYALQDRGFDTVQANEQLGFKGDERDYGIAAGILKKLGVKSVVLITNNPEKVSGLCRHGVRVCGRVPLWAKPNRHNRKYLETKKEKLSHWG